MFKKTKQPEAPQPPVYEFQDDEHIRAAIHILTNALAKGQITAGPYGVPQVLYAGPKMETDIGQSSYFHDPRVSWAPYFVKLSDAKVRSREEIEAEQRAQARKDIEAKKASIAKLVAEVDELAQKAGGK